MICQDCWEPIEDNPLCICRATYQPCPIHGGTGHVFTTPREKRDGVCPLNCPHNPRLTAPSGTSPKPKGAGGSSGHSATPRHGSQST